MSCCRIAVRSTSPTTLASSTTPSRSSGSRTRSAGLGPRTQDLPRLAGNRLCALVIGGAGYSDGAAHAGAADAAVAVGVLREVLLVIVLGVVEVPGVGDLCRDLAEATSGKHGLERVASLQRGLLLGVRRHIDR